MTTRVRLLSLPVAVCLVCTATTTYDAGTRTAVVTPAAPLTPGGVYTSTVESATATSGAVLAWPQAQRSPATSSRLSTPGLDACYPLGCLGNSAAAAMG